MQKLGNLTRNPAGMLRTGSLFQARTLIKLREAEFGYVISSDRGPIGAHRRDKLAAAFLGLAWIAGLVMWGAPQMAQNEPSVLFKLGVTALLVAGTLLLAFRNRSWGHFVIDVDTNQRVLRFGVQSARGRIKRHAQARFSEISSPLLRRGIKEGEKSRLLVKIAGQDTPLLVAAGDELTLLAVHDRLVNDLRPMEQRMASYGAWKRPKPGKPSKRRAFPALGPNEVSA